MPETIILAQQEQPDSGPRERVLKLFDAARYAELVGFTQGLEEGGNTNANTVDIVALRAISLRRLGHTREAVRNFEAAVEVVRSFDNVNAGAFGELFYELAELYGEQGDSERALAVVNEGLQIRPQSPTHQILAGYWHEKLGNSDAARAQYREVLAALAPGTEGRVVVEARLAALKGADSSHRVRVEQKAQAVRLSPPILVVPINGIDERLDLLDVCLLLEAEVQLRCTVNAMVRVPEEKLLVGERLQYNGYHLLELLRQGRPPGREDVFVLGVTNRDMYMGDARFVFSMQDTKGRVAVVSSYRLLERLPAYWDARVLATRRMLVQMLSAVGSGFGLQRPSSAHCPLAYPNSVEEFLMKGTHLCESTRAQWRQTLEAIGGRQARFDDQRLATLIRLQQRYLIESGQSLEYNLN